MRGIIKVLYLRCDAIQLCRHVDAPTLDSQNKHRSLRVLCLDPAKSRDELSFRVYLNVVDEKQTGGISSNFDNFRIACIESRIQFCGLITLW